MQSGATCGSNSRRSRRGLSSGGDGDASSALESGQLFKKQKPGPAAKGCPLTNGGDHGPCSLCSCSSHAAPASGANSCACPSSKTPKYKIYANSKVSTDWKHPRNQADLERCNLLRDRMTAPGNNRAVFEQMQRLYGVHPIMVTSLSCICRGCWDHDIVPAQAPDLPRYFKMVLNGHERLKKADEEMCYICAHLVKEYEMTNSTDPAPAYSCGHAATPKQATLFFAAAYGVTHEFVPGELKQMCSTHYNQFMKRLSTRDGALASKMCPGAISTHAAFAQTTGATWVGWHHRQCICCGESRHRSTADAWRLVGEDGPETHQRLQQWIQHSVACAPGCTVELVTEDGHVSLALTTADVPIGSCEWLCHSCWQEGTSHA